MAERKTKPVNIWLTPEQLAWLKSKKNLSETVRALITEAMSLDALAASVKRPSKKKPPPPAKRPGSRAAGRSR